MTEDELAVDELIVALQSPGDAETRADAADALGEYGGPAAVAALIGVLDHPSDMVRVSAAMALGECRDPAAVPALRPLLDGPEPNARGAACLALGQIGGPDALPLLLARAGDGLAPVRGAVAWALGELKDLGGWAALRTLEKDPDIEVADAAREALHKLRSR